MGRSLCGHGAQAIWFSLKKNTNRGSFPYSNPRQPPPFDLRCRGFWCCDARQIPLEAMNALLVLMGQDNELSGAELYPLFDVLLAELRRLCVRLEQAA